MGIPNDKMQVGDKVSVGVSGPTPKPVEEIDIIITPNPSVEEIELKGKVPPKPVRLIIYIGKKLKPKAHLRDWEDEEAEVLRYDVEKGKWNITSGGNFSAWLSVEEIEKDFEEIV